MKITYIKLFGVVGKQWENVSNIMLLCGNGKDKARQIRKEIELEIISSGKKVLEGKEKKVPMSKVIDYLNMDVDYIAKMATLEQKINNERGVN